MLARSRSTSRLDDRKSGLEVDQRREQIGYRLGISDNRDLAVLHSFRQKLTSLRVSSKSMGDNEHLRAPNKSKDRNDVVHLCSSCLHLSSAGQVRVRHHPGLPCAELCRSSRYNFPACLRELFESFFDLPKAP